MEKFYAHQIFIATFLLLLELMRGMCNCLCRVLVIISMCVQLMIMHGHIIFLMVCVLTFTAIVILKHPEDMEAVPNEWVQFNCTVTDTTAATILGGTQPAGCNLSETMTLYLAQSLGKHLCAYHQTK